jgi:MFS family permease
LQIILIVSFYFVLKANQVTTISTLEKRFGYSTSTSGDISTAFNCGALLAVLPFSYFAGKKGAAKLRYLSLGLFIIGCGSILYCLPHFISSPKKAEAVSAGSDLCRDRIGLKSDDNESKNDDAPYYLFFIFGHLLHGAGASVIFPVGISFVLENLSDHPAFIAVYPSFGGFGYAVGCAVTGAFLKINADFDQPTSYLSNEGGEKFGAWVSH